MVLNSNFKRLCIDHIPNEILAEIFLWVFVSSSAQNGLQASEILSHVCFRWRKLAHASPYIWTELTLKVNVGTDKELLTQWFSRCRGIDIVLDLDPSRSGVQPHHVIRTVCSHSNLWRRFQLSLPWSGIMTFFLIGSLCTPQLEELVIECTQSNSLAGIYPRQLTVDAGSRRTIITDCQRLKKVRIALSPSFPLEFLCSLFPWSNLTEVVLQKPGAHPALIQHIFTHCKALVRLKIWTSYWRILDFSMEPSDEFRLEHLESFEIEADLRALVHILRSVQLPVLKSLSLSGITNYDEERYPVRPTLATALMDLGKHSQFSLAEFKIFGLLDFSQNERFSMRRYSSISCRHTYSNKSCFGSSTGRGCPGSVV